MFSWIPEPAGQVKGGKQGRQKSGCTARAIRYGRPPLSLTKLPCPMTEPAAPPVPVFIPRDPDFEAKVRDSFARQPFMATLGASLGFVGPGKAEVVLPFCEAVTQQHGFFHGGVIGAIADTAGGYAAFTLFPAGSTLLTVEYKINIMAPGRGERLIAIGQVVRAGRTLTVVSVDVIAEDGDTRTHCASATQTLICLIGKDDAKAPAKA